MKFMIDIDGTICTTTNGEYEKAKPYIERIEFLNRLYDEGHVIHYWTARGSGSGKDWRELTLAQLYHWGCKFHSWNVGKPSYDVWVDDKAFNPDDFFTRS